jgi:hypothetical protein
MRARGDGPDARRPLISKRSLRLFLWSMAVLLVAEVLRANLSAKQQHDWPWNLRLLGIPTTAALFGAALIALVALDQYARSTAPLLRYVSQWASETEDLTARAARYRQVLLRNVGPGTALVVGVRWLVGTSDGGVSDVASMAALRGFLGELELVDGTDYAVTNYSPRSALGPGEERLYFECTDGALARFGVFDAVFTFESMLGDRFEKTVSLLPRPGSSDAVIQVGVGMPASSGRYVI